MIKDKKMNWPFSARKTATIFVVALLALVCALAACSPQETNQGSGEAPTQETAQSSSEGSASEGTGAPLVSVKNYAEPNAGPFTDTWYNREVLNAGNRGCSSCHSDMYAMIKNLTASDNEEYVHVIGKPGYGKNYEWRDCTACHGGADIQAASLNIRDAIHSLHFSSPQFNDNGNCLSCHAYDARGEMVMWDDLKYDREVGGHNYLDNNALNANKQKLEARDISNGSMVDVVWDPDFTLSNVKLDQPLSTNEDGSEYTFAAVNLGLRHYDASGYTVTVDGVKGKNTWTIDEIRDLPVTEKVYTQDCAGNIQNGPLISTVKATGVSLADFIEACGGLNDGIRSFTVATKDGWNCFGAVFDIEALIAQEALFAYEYNDHDLTAEQGYPLVMAIPGFGGNYMPKYIEGINFSNAEPVTSTAWTPDFAFDGNMNAGWFHPVEDGLEVKVGEEVPLSGWVYEHSSGGHEADKIAFSSDYGENWTYLDVDENLTDYDNDVWVTFEGTWVPKTAGTYVLHVKVIDNLYPELEPQDLTTVRFANYASVIIKVTE